ncbi:MAG TPA: ATP-binding cassette domain-containing protein, partial [Acidobacteriaceae bacterium]|nr:ATP-binding cassette domain-containing protein [Acidobacteriaceae bacterium]
MPSDRTLVQAAIAARDLKKKYRLFSSPAERLKEALHPLRRQFHREFWALNGVTFDVPKGQTLGIIGVNGCGKSTLLQVIAGILQPTSGRLQVDGKIAA